MIESFGDMTLGNGIVKEDNMDKHVAEFLDKPLALAAARRSADVAAVLMAIGGGSGGGGQVFRAVSELLSASPQLWPFARHLFTAASDPLQAFVTKVEITQ